MSIESHEVEHKVTLGGGLTPYTVSLEPALKAFGEGRKRELTRIQRVLSAFDQMLREHQAGISVIDAYEAAEMAQLLRGFDRFVAALPEGVDKAAYTMRIETLMAIMVRLSATFTPIAMDRKS